MPLAGSVTVEVPPPSGTSYLSDLDWTTATNGWGPVERDQSNGETGAGDGNPITIGGTVFAKGLGTNAPSTITYYLGGGCSTLSATVGVDDEKNGKGTVEFEVDADGTQVADSGVLKNADGPKPLHADVTGAQQRPADRHRRRRRQRQRPRGLGRRPGHLLLTTGHIPYGGGTSTCRRRTACCPGRRRRRCVPAQHGAPRRGPAPYGGFRRSAG